MGDFAISGFTRRVRPIPARSRSIPPNSRTRDSPRLKTGPSRHGSADEHQRDDPSGSGQGSANPKPSKPIPPGAVTVEDNGHAVHLKNAPTVNYPFDYTITHKTILAFDLDVID